MPSVNFHTWKPKRRGAYRVSRYDGQPGSSRRRRPAEIEEILRSKASAHNPWTIARRQGPLTGVRVAFRDRQDALYFLKQLNRPTVQEYLFEQSELSPIDTDTPRGQYHPHFAAAAALVANQVPTKWAWLWIKQNYHDRGPGRKDNRLMANFYRYWRRRAWLFPTFKHQETGDDYVSNYGFAGLHSDPIFGKYLK